jgi:5-methylcytosine-specific restriction endonuclease McrA
MTAEDLLHNVATKAVQRMAGNAPRPERWLDILARDPCSYCGSRQHMTMDHIHPIKLGASRRLQIMNAAPACQHCNAAKGHAQLLHFLAMRAGL